MPSRQRSVDFAQDSDLEWDYSLFHSVPGAWPSVEGPGGLRESLSNLEWLRHAAFLHRRATLQQAAVEKATRKAEARRQRGR